MPGLTSCPPQRVSIRGDAGYDGGVQLDLDLPPEPASAGLARRVLAAFLTEHGLDAAHDDGCVVVSELVTNAVRYGDGMVRLSLVDLGRTLRVAVTDGRPDSPPVPREPDTDDAGGRGLSLVAALSLRWGVEPAARPGDGLGKTVWAELPVRG